MTELRLASEKDRQRYWGLAIDWCDQQDWRYYCDDRYPALKGVAEYLANQNGETIFMSYVGRNYEKIT